MHAKQLVYLVIIRQKNKSCKKKSEAEDKEHDLSSRLYIHQCHAVKFTQCQYYQKVVTLPWNQTYLK
jgi:hypothetical protein